MKEARHLLQKIGFLTGDCHDLPTSDRRFPDGGAYRIEIPEVENPPVMRTVVAEAISLNLPIHRVSQGTGITLLADQEIREMAMMGKDNCLEVSLFTGPRVNRDPGAQFFSEGGKTLGRRLRGMDQVVYALEDIHRAVELGIRSVLIADEGIGRVIKRLKETGDLPQDLLVKTSVSLGHPNPISAAIMEENGADSFNLCTDLTLPMIAAIRQTLSIPLDMYIEVPSGLGGFMRYYELPEIVRIAAPVYLKFGLANETYTDPVGEQLHEIAISQARERVHRAHRGWTMLQRYCPEIPMSPTDTPRPGIPV